MGKYETHSLTAYKLEFSYMKRNNPCITELKEKIANNEKPKVSISNLISMIIEESKSNTYLTVDNSAFALSKLESFVPFEDGYKYVITPDVGKANSKFKVYKLDRSEPYNYGLGSVSTYSHNIYFYEFPDSSYMICHRKGGSGCKIVLEKVIYSILKEKGIKLETSLFLPTSDVDLKDHTPEKITLSYKRKQSTDIADNLCNNHKTKEKTIREAAIYLGASENSSIRKIIGDMILSRISKENAFIMIKRELNYDNYNDAEIVFKIGKIKRAVKWGNLEELFGGKDITEDLIKMGGFRENNISICADNYIKEVRSAEKWFGGSG